MTTSFLGIPVDGGIIRAEHRAVQRPIEEFAPLLQAVLDDAHVMEVGWQQYTPYFNDGDPCIFGVRGVWVRTDDPADAEADRYDLDIEDHCSLCAEAYNSEARKWERIPQEPWQRELHAKVTAFSNAIQAGGFDDVLLEAFGDHAEVAVTRACITVDTYDHD